jgi:uncharacterized membrane protein YebE (DUF533 family)
MDALQLLGSLLGNNATSSGQGGQILGQLIGGLTAGGAQGGGAGGGLADMLGGLTRGGAQGGGAGGGLADMLGGLMGGGAQSGGAGGGLAGMLGGLTRGGAQSGGAGGLADILSSLTGGAGIQGGTPHGGSGAGMLGGLVMVALQMFGQRSGAAGPSSLSGLAGMLAPGQATPAAVDTTQADQQALAFVKAMINAAKADGQIDAEEQRKIVSKLGDVGPQEAAFIREEMAKPLNFDFFADITQDLAPQVYAVSLMAINLDTAAESSYMQQLAQGLGLDPQTVNGIHAQLGLAPLYA